MIRRFAAAIAVIAPAIGVLAAPPARAESFSWQVFLGPLPIAVADATYAPDGDRYLMGAKVDTGGPSQKLFPWSIAAETVGRLIPGFARPERFRFDSLLRQKPRHMAITYAPGGATVTRAEPPLKREGYRTVEYAQTRGALDPLSAFIAVGRALAAGRGCPGVVPVFEGRWRYDLLLTDRGRQEIQPSMFAPVGGTTHRCDVRFRPVAGFDPKDLQGGWENVAGRAWFKPADKGPWFPAKIEVDLPITMLTIGLKRPVPGG